MLIIVIMTLGRPCWTTSHTLHNDVSWFRSGLLLASFPVRRGRRKALPSSFAAGNEARGRSKALALFLCSLETRLEGSIFSKFTPQWETIHACQWNVSYSYNVLTVTVWCQYILLRDVSIQWNLYNQDTIDGQYKFRSFALCRELGCPLFGGSKLNPYYGKSTIVVFTLKPI